MPNLGCASSDNTEWSNDEPAVGKTLERCLDEPDVGKKK
jgi:hypothetical protein